VRRRENNNRTTNRDLLILVLKIILIPILLVGGFLGLKAALSLIDGPSEKERTQWEADAERMEKTPAAEPEEAVTLSDDLAINKDILAERMDRWETGQRHLRAAEALERRGMDDEAVVRLRQTLQFIPDSQKAQHLLLELYMRSGSYKEAIPLCLRLLDQDSTQLDLKILLLQALQAEDETEMCMLLADRMLRERPDDLSILEMAAYAHAAEGDMDTALNFYERILEANPRYLLALEGSGYIYQFQKEWLKAVPYYLKLLELNPKPGHYMALARGYAQLGDEGKALVLLGQAYSLYGEPVVSPWLRSPDFDPVRETADFRSFLDQMVGARTRAAIEEIRRREIQRETVRDVPEFKLPSATDLEILKPGPQR
jgi:tetratricopeptide (TPR) repeat protein